MALAQIPKEVQVAANDATQWAVDIKELSVKSNEDYSSAEVLLKEIKRKYRELEEQRKGMTRPLDQAKKQIMEFFSRPLDFLTSTERSIKKTMLEYRQDLERKRIEQERKLQERAKREEDKKKEKLEDRAKKAEEKGNAEKAEELRQEAETVYIAPPTLQDQAPKSNGTHIKKIWKHRVVNESQIPREYLIVDEKKLGAIARATKGTLKIAGVEFYTEDTMAASRL